MSITFHKRELSQTREGVSDYTSSPSSCTQRMAVVAQFNKSPQLAYINSWASTVMNLNTQSVSKRGKCA